MNNQKQAIIDALRAFISGRPGFDSNNYGDAASYAQDRRWVLNQLRDGLRLLRDIELRDSITADDILKEAEGGRLTILPPDTPFGMGHNTGSTCKVHYCAGQYYSVEFRGAVARLCAAVLWTWKRGNAMPTPVGKTGRGLEEGENGHYPWYKGGGLKMKNYIILSAGDWLRNDFRREYGRNFQTKYFD